MLRNNESIPLTVEKLADIRADLDAEMMKTEALEKKVQELTNRLHVHITEGMLNKGNQRPDLDKYCICCSLSVILTLILPRVHYMSHVIGANTLMLP